MTTRARIGSIVFAGLAGLAALSAPGVAGAANPYFAPNYVFPDGITGFHLSTQGGNLNPGVLVGFNPQPDPPGTPLPYLDLSLATHPIITSECDGSIPGACDGSFRFELALTGLSGYEGHLLPAVQMPSADGLTLLDFTADGSVFVLSMVFSGPGGVSSWASFNPQPDPPGDIIIPYDIIFGGDASVALQLTENGARLSFGVVPEPSTWALMALGFATLGVLGYRRANRPAV